MRVSSPGLAFACAAVCAAVLVSGGVALAREAPASPAAADPEFKLGFRALADLIPGTVGDPLEAEHPGAKGTTVQATAGGLMVWREAANWTGFTDGSSTWVNGPLGLQRRGNDERFDWETVSDVADTEVVVFRPAGVEGPDREGRCFSSSLASVQPDAWRCSSDNQILDPCFATPGDPASVLCGARPAGSETAFKLKLTEPLPTTRPAPGAERAWVLELADGTRCGFLTGATAGFEGKRLNYGCTDGSYLLGDPEVGDLWIAEQIFVSADRRSIANSYRVRVRAAWL